MRCIAKAATGCAPSQLIMGRMIRTQLPRPTDELTPKWPDMEKVKKKDEEAKNKNAQNYNRIHGAKPLPEIPEGALVRRRLTRTSSGQTQW